MADGFTVAYRPDGILVYEFTQTHRAAMDAWFRISTHHDREYAAAKRHLRRIIIIKPQIVLHPYGLDRLRTAASQTPDTLVESLALIGRDKLSSQMLNILLRMLPVNRDEQSQLRAFANEDDAVRWLDARLQLLGDYQGAM